MKKTITIEVLLLFVLAVLVAVIIPYMDITIKWFEAINRNINQGITPSTPVYKEAYKNLTYTIFSFLAAIADIAVIVLVAIKEFKLFQPFIEKRNDRKAERAAAREAKAEESKQSKIAELEKQLDELKRK